MAGSIAEQRSHDPLTINRIRLALAWRPEGDDIWQDPSEEWMWDSQYDDDCPCCQDHYFPTVSEMWEAHDEEVMLFQDHGFQPIERYTDREVEEIKEEISLCEAEAFFPSTETSRSSPTRRNSAPPWRRGF